MINRTALSCWLQKAANSLIVACLILPAPCIASGPPPVITVQPQSQYAPLLGIVTFSVTASSGTTMTYQWFKDGVAIAGATSSSYTILTLLGSDSGVFSVKVTNAGGSVMSANAYLNIVPPPTITTQPQSQAVTRGTNVSFSVSASSSGSISYRWYFNGAPLGGSATSSTYTITNVITGNAGDYTAVVANSTGSTTSSVATLTVLVPPVITSPPQNQAVSAGQTASFSAVAGGTAPLSYQWKFNDTALPGATSSVLTLTNVHAAGAGSYSVVVTNVAGSVTSAGANLIVTNPSIALSVSSGAGMTPSGFTFQFSAPAGITYIILASTNCQDWAPIATNVALAGSTAFTDTSASNFPSRFYRLMVP